MDTERFFHAMAQKYIWWQKPAESLGNPARLHAQIMNFGSLDEFLILENAVGMDALRDVLSRAEAGWLHPRSWTYWHYRLFGAETVVPLLPKRPLAHERVHG